MSNPREQRLSEESPKPDQRSPFQVDRDRILYSDAFRRLGQVTQVVSPENGDIYHNRLTHTLKVAQVARRLAEYIGETADSKIIEAWGGLDPDVVEAAALAHDLGHPPFGHLAETALNHLVGAASDSDTGRTKTKTDRNRPKKVPREGYEGNAQSFRIVTRLAIRSRTATRGLDLTRATLNACLKYPTIWKANLHKYGAYTTEKQELAFARELSKGELQKAPSLEAQIMDWADDITYSIHDTEDFYRAGLIPLDRIASNINKEQEYFKRQALERRSSIGKPWTEDAKFSTLFENFFGKIGVWIKGPYDGRRIQRQLLYEFTSSTIDDYIKGTQLHPPSSVNNMEEALQVDPKYKLQVEILKELTWCYVIHNPGLAGHQQGQRKAIGCVFKALDDAISQGRWELVPIQFREEVKGRQEKRDQDIPPNERARLVADIIASMNDHQAMRLYQRIEGISQGSVLDPILR